MGDEEVLAYAEFDEARVSHLEMIQTVVSRLGTNGFIVKGWAITVTGAFDGVALKTDAAPIALLALVPILMFWALDTFFLRAERLFRALFQRVAALDVEVEPFCMNATGPRFAAHLTKIGLQSATRWSVWQRPALLVLYLGLALTSGVIALLTL